jgi:hypothetical protein
VSDDEARIAHTISPRSASTRSIAYFTRSAVTAG